MIIDALMNRTLFATMTVAGLLHLACTTPDCSMLDS